MILQRTDQNDQRTFGELRHDDGTVQCLTLELPWRQNAHGTSDVASCVPAGTYPAFRFTSPHLGYQLFQLANVPDRVGIDIHVGNTPSDSEGCILLGNERGTIGGVDAVMQSKAAFTAFMQSLQGIDRFVLTVRDVVA